MISSMRQIERISFISYRIFFKERHSKNIHRTCTCFWLASNKLGFLIEKNFYAYLAEE